VTRDAVTSESKSKRRSDFDMTLNVECDEEELIEITEYLRKALQYRAPIMIVDKLTRNVAQRNDNTCSP
jgi:hypothetical protein